MEDIKVLNLVTYPQGKIKKWMYYRLAFMSLMYWGDP